jgi:hypothetical protein
MRQAINETLRSKEPTPDGRHLHEPDGFPHSMIAVLAFFVVGFPIVVGIFYVTAGIGGALLGAGLLLFVGFPLVTAKLNRRVETTRVVEEDEEREVEAAEALGVPPPKTHMERINERLNRTYDEKHAHPHR